jgi:hypothetical protein
MAGIGGVTSLCDVCGVVYELCGVRPGTGCSLGGSGGIGDGGLGPETFVILGAPCDALLPDGCSTVVVPPGPVVVVVVVVVYWQEVCQCEL